MAAGLRPRINAAHSRIVLFDATVVVDAARVVVHLVAHIVDAQRRLFVHNIFLQRVLDRSQIRQLPIDLKSNHI